MAEHGITLPPLVGFGQGYESFGPAVDEFERRLLGAPVDAGSADEPAEPLAEVEQLRHDGNPVLTWNAANAVLTHDPANNRKVDKAKSVGRIDGVVASIMACGISGKGRTLGGPSVYDKGIKI
ncbi:MAG: hypothetical protein GAK34_02737 [Delftia tsuruhatensis]|nr:MAG: hypothetical protein GAK34_02737 [Delftia tsuruhatensis]